MLRRRLFAAVLAAAATAFAAAGPAGAETKPITGAKPLSPQPAADKIQPGLAVVYYFNMFNKLNEIGKLGKGKPGEPIKLLDHKTNDGNVLTADRSMGVGAKITGLIKFDRPGTYVFQVNSNDGVRVTIAGIKTYENDGVHADELSDPIPFVVEQPGWYELAVDYFQKKGTSALQLFWTPPGGTQTPVPASQFAHIKG
jgi:hypothetical protein